MMDTAKDTEMLKLAQAAKDDPEPAWKDPKWAYVFIVGGIAFLAWDLIDKIRPGAGAGFMIGIGLGALLIQVPISRHLWRCYRLLRQAQEAGVFEQPES